jgi:hypothetical protein
MRLLRGACTERSECARNDKKENYDTVSMSGMTPCFYGESIRVNSVNMRHPEAEWCKRKLPFQLCPE